MSDHEVEESLQANGRCVNAFFPDRVQLSHLMAPFSPLPTIPLEVLSQIMLMTKHRRLYDLSPSRTLARCARVDKHWLHAARLALYTCVYLGNADDGLPYACHHLLRTLRRTPALASLVLEIRYASLRMHRTETAALAKIIDRCPNLKEVEIHGWNGYELKALHRALGAATGLRDVLVSRYAMSDTRCDAFHHLPKFFEMIQRWPELRSLNVYRDALGFSHAPSSENEDQHFAANFSVQDGACPHLRDVAILSNIEDRHLVALARIAPAVRTIYLSGYQFSAAGFGRALEADRLHDVIPSLSNLRVFRFYTENIPITVLSKGLAALEVLQISLEAQDELAVLHAILRSNGLPALRRVYITMSHRWGAVAKAADFAPGVWDAFERTCAERGIRLQEQTLQDRLVEDNGQALPRITIDRWLERSWHFRTGDEFDDDFGGGSELEDEDEDNWDEDDEDDDSEDWENINDEPDDNDMYADADAEFQDVDEDSN
ncbi:hypothetical protein OF83DRAFT_1111656 [Amylostereum chailletii]|nr:hypothetical protein OF83DRAFT_1111656 [Amylostereum chailletii]